MTVATAGSCLALVQAAADAFHEQYPEAHIRTVRAEGFRATESLLGGTAGLVVLTRDLLPEERQAAARVKLTLRSAMVAVEGIAVIVHPSNHLTEVAESQLGPVVNGTLRRWVGIHGGADSLQVFAPEPSTGTGSFVAGLCRNISRSPVYFQESDSAVVAEVAQRPQALGFVGSGYLVRSAPHHPRIHVLDIVPTGDGTAASVLSQASLADGSYPLTSAVTAITRGEPDGLAAGFLAFLTSQRGQRAVQRAGFAPVASSSIDVHLR